MYSTTLSSVQIKIKKVCNTWDFHQALNYLHLRGDWLKCPSRTSLEAHPDYVCQAPRTPLWRALHIRIKVVCDGAVRKMPEGVC